MIWSPPSPAGSWQCWWRSVWRSAWAVLTLAVSGESVPQADLTIARWLQGIGLPGWSQALSVGEWLTGAPGGVIVWFAVVGAFWLSGRPVEAIVTGLTAAIWIPKAILEEVVARPRPPEDLLAVTALADGFAFPSGHITAGVAVLGMLAIIAIVRLGAWRSRAWVLAPVALILTVSAFSRVASGAHWPSDVLAGFLLGGLWLLGMAWLYTSLRADTVPGAALLSALRRRLRPPATSRAGLRTAGSIASTVYLDDAAGIATKVYRPPLPVRALYWAAFQAPFPYASCEASLRTAAAARELTGLLTRYWTGEDMVARVTAIRRVDGEFHLDTELIQGAEPADNASMISELRSLRRRFAQAGLPTWQIDAENPHAHTNFIRTPDGRLKIIDLESTLVPLIQPLRTWPRMFRTGRAPQFDDVDYPTLRAYVAAERISIAASLGEPDLERLEAAIDQAEAASREWKSAEPALWGRLARRVWGRIGWERRSAPVRRQIARADDLAMDFLTKPLDRWVVEGRLSAEEAAAIRSRLCSDSTRLGMRHLGAAVAISIPLRFPFGSLTRAAAVLYFRNRAGRQHAEGEIDSEAYRRARETHTLTVAAVALIPGLGASAYLLSPTLRRNGNLIPLVIDQALYTLPFGMYARLRLGRLGRPGGDCVGDRRSDLGRTAGLARRPRWRLGFR